MRQYSGCGARTVNSSSSFTSLSLAPTSTNGASEGR